MKLFVTSIAKYYISLIVILTALSCSQSIRPVNKGPARDRAVTSDEIHILITQKVTYEAMTKLISQYTRKISLNTGRSDLYIARGDAYFKMQKYEKAVKDYSKAIELHDIDEAYFKRGLAYGRNTDFDEGIADLSIYIKRHPRSSLAYTKRGVRHLWKEDFRSAKKDFITATTLDPRNAEAHDDLGVIYARQANQSKDPEYQAKMYGKAIEHFLATIKADPTYQKAYHNVAIAYYIMGQNSQALLAINYALNLSPDAQNSLFLKVSILKALGRLDEAKKLQKRAVFVPEVCHWTESVPMK
ncbi:MAG: hypothetical protein IEMM0008_1579 [bacterium]|nr:MAG: hypothetical protein IEMM0008_1579 [bacterium]